MLWLFTTPSNTMGKGTGKGKCGGDCCNVDAYSTEEGKCAAKTGLAGSILEGIGLVVNLYPACCVCCMAGGVGLPGMPICILILLGGIANFVGSIVAVCKKSMCGLVTFVVTSWISLILRILAMVIIGVMTQRLDVYCEENADDGSTKTYYYGDTVVTQDDDGNMDTCEAITDAILGYFATALVIIGIWLIVSLAGAVLGTRGVLVEPPESAESCKCPCGVQEPAQGKHETVAVVVGEEAVTKEPAV